MLTFVEETHTYYWNGEPVPNVTRIIAPLTDYSRIPPAVLEKARQEGVAVHKMVELDCKGDLDVETLPEWMHPHYTAWLRFKEESGFECWKAEEKMYHPVYGYAGTADLFGPLPKLKGIKGAANIDVKRSFFGGPAIGLQTAGYTRMWNDTDGKARERRVADRNRFALQLRNDGTYRLKRFEDAEDFGAFLACLQQLRWREKHGIA